jgi:hypothetical protein
MERESFVFYRSFFESISCLTKEQKADCLDAIAKYALDGEVIEMDGIIKALFLSMKPQIDANTRRYANGCRGGKPKSNQNETKAEPKSNQTITKPEPKSNQNETKTEPKSNQKVTKPEPNVNVNDNENEKITPLTPLKGEKEKKPSDLVEEKNFPAELKEAVLQWLKYKREKRQAYQETGLKNFLTQVKNNMDLYGAETVAAVIKASMGANYQGVVWDWLRKNAPPKAANDWDNIR